MPLYEYLTAAPDTRLSEELEAYCKRRDWAVKEYDEKVFRSAMLKSDRKAKLHRTLCLRLGFAFQERVKEKASSSVSEYSPVKEKQKSEPPATVSA